MPFMVGENEQKTWFTARLHLFTDIVLLTTISTVMTFVVVTPTNA